MPLKRYLPAWIVVAVVLPLLDFVWFALITRSFYQGQIGGLLRRQTDYGPAAIFYLAYAVGIVVFVVAPAADRGGWRRAAAMGLLFGLISYGVYDLTNLATLKGFTLATAVVDMGWGAFATAIAASLGARVATGRGAVRPHGAANIA
jgi:uncharacterized membrane protein